MSNPYIYDTERSQYNTSKYNLLEKTDYRCYYCGCELLVSTTQIEHLIPKIKGGDSRLKGGNIVPSCFSCNMKKGTKTIADFRKKLFGNKSNNLFYFEKLIIMAKRFTDTDKWKKQSLKSMPAAYKLLWLYICDDCDNAGIWHADFEIAEIRIGSPVEKEEAIKIFAEKIIVFDNGEKWFVPGFIEFQYGELNPKNKAHESVLKKLQKYKLLEKLWGIQAPSVGAKYMDMDKEMDKEKALGKSENPLSIDPVDPSEPVAPVDPIEPVTDPDSLMHQMYEQFKTENPKYYLDKKVDFPALLELAKKIKKMDMIDGEFNEKWTMDMVKKRWGELIPHIAADSHFSKYSIFQINKHFQSIIQSFFNGGANKQISRQSKLGTSEARIKTAKDW